MKRINLTPKEIKKVKKVSSGGRGFGFLKSGWLWIAIIIGGFLIILNSRMSEKVSLCEFKIIDSKKQVDGLKKEISQSQTTLLEMKSREKKIEEEIKISKDKLKIIEGAQISRMSLAKILTSVSEIIPEDLWVKKIKVSKTSLVITGTTFSNIDVSRFMSKMDEAGYFENTSFNYTQKTKVNEKQVMDFEVTAQIK